MNEPKVVHVSAVAPMRPDGLLLMGKRRDDGSWCCPGGHVEEGEHPLMAAHRELGEESGLDTDTMEHLGSQPVKDGAIVVHAFKADVDAEPSNDEDPDDEFSEFQWVDPENMPVAVLRNLHNTPDVVLELIGARGQPWATMHAEPDADDFGGPPDGDEDDEA